MPNPNFRRLVFVLLFFSGACGLVYQVVWTRMMTLVFGISVYAVATVLCSFMAGLALGSAAFGRLADRSRRPLALYGALEIGVGLFALAFPAIMRAAEPLFVHIYRNHYINYDLFSLARFAVIFAVLIIPTFLMGGTFPVASRYFVRGAPTIGRDVAALYAVNTAGAVAGTVLVGFVMLATLGSRLSIFAAAAINLAVGAAAIALGRKPVDIEPPDPAPSADSAAASASTESLSDAQRRAILLAAGVSGFVSLGLEILWTRMLVFHTHNSTYAFSAMLAVFLVGIALGSAVFGFVGPRLRRPEIALAATMIAIAAWSAFTPRISAALPALAKPIAAAIAWDDWREAMALIVIQSAAMILVPTFLMGISFPLMIRLLTRGMDSMASGVGRIYAINTLGTVLGSFVVGFILIPSAGVRNSTLLLSFGCAFMAVALLLADSSARAGRAVPAAAGLAAFIGASWFLVPKTVLIDSFREGLGEILFYKEEVTDTIMVIDLMGDSGQPSKANRTLVFADGRGTAGHWTVMEDRFYGHLPMLLHEKPEDVLVICVGAGNTIGAISQHKRLKNFDCVELSTGVPEAAQYFETNTGVFHSRKDPRIHLHNEDGRNYLLGTDKSYDIIHLDPPELHTAGVVFLYTEEFYELCKVRLKPGGIMSHWFNATKMTDGELRQIVGTFKKVFPHGTIWQGPGLYSWNLIATDKPLTIPFAAARATLDAEPDVKQNLAEVNLADPALLFSYLLMSEETLGEYTSGARIITDDKTMIDFSNPKQGTSGFGFANLMSATRTLLKESGAGYERLAELTEATDSPALLVDWRGIAEADRAATEKKIEENVQARRGIARKYLPAP